ncbi:MAG: hypothetical protein QHJ34_02465 [bacterium]|nr:hypothetical protein [candidate division KSB1 bacterium]MDH7559081.1 hypothetical protein [bacterium]
MSGGHVAIWPSKMSATDIGGQVRGHWQTERLSRLRDLVSAHSVEIRLKLWLYELR